MKIFNIMLFFSVLVFAAPVFAQKLTAEEIIAKHLDSIGAKEKRAGIKNMLIGGAATYESLRSATYRVGKGAGNCVFLSDANKIYLGAKFNATDYSTEEIIYSGKEVNTSYVRPGQRSALGNYIINNRDIVEEGLFGGALSTNWNLLDPNFHGAKLKSAGKKKIDGRDTYILSYIPAGRSPLNIKLYFDAATFEHVQTEYFRSIPAPFTGVMTESSFQVETRQVMTEKFSNFKKENNLSLPHSYQINLLFDGRVTDEIEWKFDFQSFNFNQNVDPTSFDTK